MNHLRVLAIGGIAIVLCEGVCVISFLLLRLITVRRLLRDPRTRNRLGLDLYPGWQTLNVASTLSWTRAKGRYFDSRPLAVFRAHSETVYAHTNLLDRCLARACYTSQMLICALLVGLLLYDRFA